MQSLERAQTRVEVYAFKVTLLDTSPPVWRRILVPREITLRNLHRTLQTVMGWNDSHLHQFVFQRQGLSDPRSRVGSNRLKALPDRNCGQVLMFINVRVTSD
jgi:hypothetical protein